jgi:hypothetical protein
MGRRPLASGQFIVEHEVGCRGLELEWERNEWRGERALPGVVSLEPRPVLGGHWPMGLSNSTLAGVCWSWSERGVSGGASMPFRDWRAEATASGQWPARSGFVEREVG